MGKLISIIMPTYNRGYIIQKAIDSVLTQTYENWELIIVDDGSTDDTAKVVATNQDERIRYISYELNRGANHARNVGIAAAKGNYYAFLDSDNTYNRNSLKDRMECLMQYNADIVWSRAKLIDVNNNYTIQPGTGLKKLNDRERIVPIVLTQCLINTSTIMIKKECYLRTGGFDEKFPRFQDWDFFIRLISEKKCKVTYLPKITAINYIQKDSISYNNEALRCAYPLLLRKHLKLFRKYGCFLEALKNFVWGDGNEWNRHVLPVIELLTETELRSFIELSRTKILEMNRENMELRNSANVLIHKMRNMEWHFPREQIPAGSCIVVYGAGDVGNSFVKQIEETVYCQVVLWVDKNYMLMGEDIHSPNEIVDVKFDYILVAIYKKEASLQAKNFLVKMGISERKIITI